MKADNLSFVLFENIGDNELEIIKECYCKPEIERFVSIDKDSFWIYATETENVYFYKVYNDDILSGTVHCELCDGVLYLAVVVFPEFQNKKIATAMVNAVLDGITGLEFNEIQVSVDEKNAASLKLFRNIGFVQTGQEDELVEFKYIM